MIDCREAVRRMWTYLDQALETEPTDELEAHLATCQRCCGELEFSRHLRRKVAAGEASAPLPSDVRLRLEELIGGSAPASKPSVDR
jgi:mycothiol system anti-sigma-R factor